MKSKILLAILTCGLIALAGCEKKTSGGGGGGSDDPNGYELYIADPEIGTPTKGTFHMDMRVTGTVNGVPKSETIKEDMAFRETALDRPAGSRKPTRSSI